MQMIEYEPCCGVSCASSGMSEAVGLKDGNKGMFISKVYFQHHCQCREYSQQDDVESKIKLGAAMAMQESQFIIRSLFEIMTSHYQSTI